MINRFGKCCATSLDVSARHINCFLDKDNKPQHLAVFCEVPDFVKEVKKNDIWRAACGESCGHLEVKELVGNIVFPCKICNEQLTMYGEKLCC